MSAHAPTFYSAYGLIIASDLPLQGFEGATDERAPDVVIQQGVIDKNGSTNDWGQCVVGEAPGVLQFRVTDGSSIVYNPVDGGDALLMRSVVAGELLAVLLRQRGFLTLHAACVARGNECILIVGDSGWGKSTLSTYFAGAGYTLISDDIACIDLDAIQVQVQPGPSSVRLHQHSASLISGFQDLPPAHGATKKRVYVHEGPRPSHPVQLRGIVLLQPGFSGQNHIQSVKAGEAIRSILEHTRGRNLLRAAPFQERHLAQCAALVRRVPMYALERRKGLVELGAQRALIEGAMGLSLHELEVDSDGSHAVGDETNAMA